MAASGSLVDLASNNSGSIPETTKTVPPSPLPEWGSDAVPIKDFPVKRTVPGFAKIVKGNYMTLGSSKFSFQKQHHEVFIHSVKAAVKVLAHSVRRVETTGVTKRTGQSVITRMYAIDQRLAIPITYQGWFELLSEDGKSARPIASVHELSKIKPKRFLVRENMKAYILNNLSASSKMTFDKTRIVLAGEHLVLSGELSLPSPDQTKKVKLLRCIDSKGDEIYLSFDQKGLFTVIAGENDFTGVFLIRDIVKRFRLPLTVKLVQGMRPKVDPARFTGIIRLDWVYTDETAFVCPIEKNQIRLLPVPTDANLQLVTATNQYAMKSTELYHNMITKCNRMISNYNNTIHLIVNLPDAASKGIGRTNSNVFSMPLAKSEQSSKKSRSEKRQNRLMDEIDDLYGYVRDGGVVPKFQYDSDEESFWEEPAYEPLDDFRARLQALEAGERVTYHSKYQPHDLEKFDLLADAGKESESTYGILNGASQLPKANVNNGKPQPPPLPPRMYNVPQSPSPPTSGPPDVTLRRQSSKESPPPLAPRRHSEQLVGRITTVSSHGIVSSSQIPQSHQREVSAQRRSSMNSEDYRRRNSHGSVEYQRRLSRGSSGEPVAVSPQKEPNPQRVSSSRDQHHRRLFARDFKDSDISSITKGSSSSSSGQRVGKARKKLQTLYL